MSSKNFTQFTENSSPANGAYLVGYEGTGEQRTTIGDLVGGKVSTSRDRDWETV